MYKLICLFLVLPSFSSEAQSVKVMTYNIRYDNPGDGPNQWGQRKTNVFALIRKYDPDIIGVQEALHHQLMDIQKDLKAYRFFGAGRDDGKEKGEYSAIFVRRKRFRVLDENTFWLSLSPNVPGSKNWDAAITRVVTWGKLQDKKSRSDFYIVNTHFDHRGSESRRHSAGILKDSIAVMAKALPVILTGDFNFTRDQPPYEVMMDPSTVELTDTAPAQAPGTACGFEVGARPCSAIDYIFHTRQWNAAGYQVIQDQVGKYYPSDHLPVMVTLTMQK